MIERFIHAVHTASAEGEDPSATRERLKDQFPRGATRRMTQLGLLVGTALQALQPGEDDAVVYASEYAESRALEAYLDSFPTASPTLFQTSIHPSGVQQVLIGRQQKLRQLFPMTGRGDLLAQALETAALAGAARVLLCGGEERGTWLTEHGAASAHTFGFGVALSAQAQGALGKLVLTDGGETTSQIDLFGFFLALRERKPLAASAGAFRHLQLTW